MKINTAKAFATRVLTLSEWKYRYENYQTIARILHKNNYPHNIIQKAIKHAQNIVLQKYLNIRSNLVNINTNTQNQQQIVHNPNLVNNNINNSTNTPITTNSNGNSNNQNPQHNTNTSNLENNNNSNNITSTTQNSNSTSSISTEKKYFYKSLTYVPSLSENLSKKIKSKNEKIKIALKPNNQMKNHYTKLKDRTSKEETSAVIYKVECHDCGKNYIGHTSRKLKDRLYEHDYYIRSKSPSSGLAAHALNNRHKFNFEGTKILGTESNRKKRETKEIINIYKNQHNTVNIKQDVKSFKRVYDRFI
jgi:hypothetical protein